MRHPAILARRGQNREESIASGVHIRKMHVQCVGRAWAQRQVQRTNLLFRVKNLIQSRPQFISFDDDDNDVWYDMDPRFEEAFFCVGFEYYHWDATVENVYMKSQKVLFIHSKAEKS